MTRAKRILLIASMLVLSVGGANASWFRHRKAEKAAPQPADAALPTTTMSLTAVDIDSTPAPQLVLRTSGTPAFTSLSPTPDQFIVDLSGTTKSATLAMPSPLPPTIAAVTADEVTEMGSRLTRVSIRLTQPATLQAAANGNSVVIALPRPVAVAEMAPAKPAQATAQSTAAVPESVATAPVSTLPKATTLKKIDTSGSGPALEVHLATDGDVTWNAFKLEKPTRVVIDLNGIKNKLAKNTINLGDPLVKRIRVAQFKSDVTRVVLDLDEKVDYNVSKSGDRLMVTFGDAAKTTAMSAPAPAPTPAPIEAAPAPAQAKPVETAKTVSADVTALVPTVAENAATWKMPPSASQGATSVIHAAADQAPPTPTPRAARTSPAPATNPPVLGTTENVFNEPQPGTTRSLGSVISGGRTLSATEKVYNGEPLSLNLKDADIKDVIRTFADLTGLNVAVDPGVTGSVTVNFVDVPWDQALDLILRQNNLSYKLEGNVLRVGTLARLTEEEAANQRLMEQERLNVPLTTVSLHLSYARATDVAGLLREIASPRAKIIVDARTNQLIISEIGSPYLQTMRNLIESVDVPSRQVVIEARIVTANQTFLQQFGVNWGFRGTLDPSVGTGTGLVFPNRVDFVGGGFEFGPGNPVLSFSLANILGTFTLDLALRAAEQENVARVVAAPRIQTQDNVAADIESGVQIPLQTRVNFTTTVQYTSVTLHLSVTPQITEAGTVIMDISVSKNDLGGTAAGAPGPSINTRAAHTRLMVRDGGTSVIGGIYQTTDLNSQSRLPVLHQIPVIGNLFKTHDINLLRDELLIFITPRIVRTS